MFPSFVHFNIVVSGLSVSVPFYERIGFRQRERVDPEGLDPAFHPGLKADVLTAVIGLAEAGDEMPMLDLFEFLKARSQGMPRPLLHRVGIGRVALRIIGNAS